MSGNRFDREEWAEFLLEDHDFEWERVTMEFLTVVNFRSHVEDIISDMHDAIGCEGADVHTDSMLAICELRGDGSGLWEARDQHHATLRDMVHACPRIGEMLQRLGLDWSQQSVAKYLGVLEGSEYFSEGMPVELRAARNVERKRRIQASAMAYESYLKNCRDAGSIPHGS